MEEEAYENIAVALSTDIEKIHNIGVLLIIENLGRNMPDNIMNTPNPDLPLGMQISIQNVAQSITRTPLMVTTHHSPTTS